MKQITEAARKANGKCRLCGKCIFNRNMEQGKICEMCDKAFIEGFKKGAKWALENQWHDASKELPCNSAEIKKDFDVTEYVLCIGRNGYCFTDYMAFSHKDKTWKWAKDFIVMFWMSIPSLPKDIIHT